VLLYVLNNPGGVAFIKKRELAEGAGNDPRAEQIYRDFDPHNFLARPLTCREMAEAPIPQCFDAQSAMEDSL